LMEFGLARISFFQTLHETREFFAVAIVDVSHNVFL
jgi:hypothetical protein